MNPSSDPQDLWLTRRDGVVRGPFPATWVRRYILLGRIRLTDELRLGAGEWRSAFRCEELIPEVLRQPLTEDALARLKQARREADERGPGDRRAVGDAAGEQDERRSGRERRRPESGEEARFRAMRARELCVARVPPPLQAGPRRGALLLILVAVLALLVAL